MVENAREKVGGDKRADTVGCGAIVFGAREVQRLQLEDGEVFVDANGVNDVEVAGGQGEGGEGRRGFCSGGQKFAGLVV